MSDIMKKLFYQQRLDFERMSALFDSQHSMPEDVVEEKNIAYLPDAKNVHELDVFYPVRSVKQPIPVMVNIHGGGLLIGNKEFNRFFCARFSELGYLVFSVEYPLVPDCQVYDQFAAIAAALKYIKEHLSEYHGDPDRIYGTADSGGAYLLTYVSAMSGCQKLADAAKVTAPDLHFNALGLISGMFYTTKLDKIGLFLPPYLYGKHYKKGPFAPYINPEHPDLVTALPPCFLATSECDYLKRYSMQFERALSRHNVPHKLLCFPKDKRLPHAFSMFKPDLPESRDAINAIHSFFLEHADKSCS